MSKKILVIDDEKPTLKMFALLLGAMGYEVLTAENGEQGLAVFNAEKPELVLTDIKMPIMDGIEALRQIKSVNPFAEVIVITGHGDMDLAIKSLNLDATDFINKPVKREGLADALKRAEERLALSRSQQEQFQLETVDNASILRVAGNVTATNVARFSQLFKETLESGAERIVLHFDNNVSINGAGITVLGECLAAATDRNRRVILAGLSDNFRYVLEMMGVVNRADLYPHVDAALEAD